MSSILIAYATSEGQTAKISDTLAKQLGTAGHAVDLADLASRDAEPDVSDYDAVIVAASVHAGKHQDSVLRFVTEHAEALRPKPTAFLSVSMFAVATEEASRQRADEQVASFLKQVDWKPDLIEKLGGALRYSQFSGLWRWIFRLSQRLFRKQLDREGWPDLTVDREFTDWDTVRRFGTQFDARLRPV